MISMVKKRSDYFRKQVINKYFGIEERFLWWVGESKDRLIRIIQLIFSGIKAIRVWSLTWWKNLPARQTWQSFVTWWRDLTINIADFIGIGELYQTASDLFKFNTRPLSSREIKVAQSVFGDALSYELIRLDESAFIGPRQGKFAYVSFHTINSWGKMPDSILIHELMHVWQYEQMGAVYIPKALAAQHSKHGYDYGGLEALEEHQAIGLKAFNLEQQADIVADYYRIKNDIKPQWAKATKADLGVYESYIGEIRRD